MANKYKLVWPKRIEADGLHLAGEIVDLSGYTPKDGVRLVRECQYALVEVVRKKAVKLG